VGHVRLRYLGDPDALILGDYNLPHVVGRFFTGAARSTDAEMLEHLEPFRGQRARAVRWIKTSGIERARFGPRTPLRLTP
jgi:3-methyladenine DNA glycosylase/8-oxoguanine DNA glycosylase